MLKYKKQCVEDNGGPADLMIFTIIFLCFAPRVGIGKSRVVSVWVNPENWLAQVIHAKIENSDRPAGTQSAIAVCRSLRPVVILFPTLAVELYTSLSTYIYIYTAHI